jgi:hypothetical protein
MTLGFLQVILVRSISCLCAELELRFIDSRLFAKPSSWLTGQRRPPIAVLDTPPATITLRLSILYAAATGMEVT